MRHQLAVAFAVVLFGAIELSASPAEAAPASSGCNVPTPFPCSYLDPENPEWEIEMACSVRCPDWTFATCGTTALTCYNYVI